MKTLPFRDDMALAIMEGHQTVCKVRTGAERYFAERMAEPEFAASYAAATVVVSEEDGT